MVWHYIEYGGYVLCLLLGMGNNLGRAILIGLLSLSVFADDSTPQSVWHEKMMIRDRISRDDGRILEIVGFSLSRGDFSMEVDQVNRQIISITGAMHDMNPEMFQVLQTRLEQKPLEGWGTQINDETIDGERDRIVKINVKDLGLTFSEDFIWTIRNSESLDLKFSIQNQNKKKATMTLEVNLGNSTSSDVSNVMLLNKVQI